MPKYVLNSLLAGVFSITFSATPYAQAADDKSPINQVKTYIKDTKLTTTKSYSEMFAKLQKQNTKVNPLVFRQIAEAMAGEKFPSVQVQEFTYKGKDALKVMLNLSGEQVVIEYLFHGDEVMKINGTVFKTADTASSEAFDKKLKTIEAFHKIYQQFQKKVFNAATVPTLQQWNKLTKAQRAEFFLRHRQLLEAAYKVHNTGPFKVVSANDKTFEQWVQSTFLGEDAYADRATGTIGGAPAGQPARPPGSTDVTSQAQQEATAVANAKKLTASMGNPDQFAGPGEPRGPSCIVAGYAREWKGQACPWDGGSSKGAEKFYKDNPTSQECRDSKGKGFIACNPLIYGFDSGGKPHCIDTSIKTGTTENFNFATHGQGPCETRSPLNTAADKMSFIKGILEREKIPGADTLKCKDESGKLKEGKDCTAKDTLVTTNPDLFKRIMGELSGPIAKYIDSAKKICEEKEGKWNYKAPNPPSGKSTKKDPAYQDDACDALMKRAIAVQNLLTTEETKPDPVLAGPCSDWTPTDGIEEITGPNNAKTCGCKNKDKCRPDPINKACVPLDRPAPAPAAGEEVADLAKPETIKDGADCGSYWTRMNPMVSECPATGGDWFKTFLGIVGGICLTNSVFDTHITGLCASKRKTASTPIYVPPVDPCPATGCPPTTPTDPTTPTEPRTSEEVTNQNSPVYNPIQVPPR